MIKVLIAEDSGVTAMLLKAVIESQPDMEVVGVAEDGRKAVAMAAELKPDLVTMDVRMPVMDGLEATREIMENDPRPIVVVSAHVNDEELKVTFRALEVGALTVLEKPHDFMDPGAERRRLDFIATLRAMAETRVVRRRRAAAPARERATFATAKTSPQACELIAIGCSTGGPQALQEILGSFADALIAPIVVVQHISAGFIGGMISWMQRATPLHLKLAQDGERLDVGTVYFAPDDRHLLVQRAGEALVCRLTKTPPVNLFRPSATPLMKSVADACPANSLGVLLSGMGQDGAEGMLAMRRAGCHTVVQDKSSSVVFGMPKAALDLEAVERVINLADMSDYLTRIAGVAGRKAGTA